MPHCRHYVLFLVPLQVSGGGRHTLMLAASGQILACGCNENGQLGCPGDASASTPRPVHGLPTDGTSLYVCAGGDYSLVAVQSSGAHGDAIAAVCQRSGHGDKWRPLQVPRAADFERWQAAGDVAALIAALERTFSCPGFLIYAFATQGPTERRPYRQLVEAMEVDGPDGDAGQGAGQEAFMVMTQLFSAISRTGSQGQAYNEEVLTALAKHGKALLQRTLHPRLF
jgi:Regulator of chromosome condensation (RCC1) repeat